MQFQLSNTWNGEGVSGPRIVGNNSVLLKCTLKLYKNHEGINFVSTNKSYLKVVPTGVRFILDWDFVNGAYFIGFM